MKSLTILDYKIPVSLGAMALTLAMIIGEYINGGVVTHHLLADDNLPGISNWWGLVTIPLLTWAVIALIKKRQDNATSHTDSNGILYRFFGALAFGIIMSILWGFRLEEIMQYLILLPVVIAFFRPVYLPECLLGFVYGMLYTFGGILPILIGLVLTVLCFIAYKVIRGGILFLISKI
ncbi:hypothetical protein J0X14_11330 [Muricauda sp. CAU 1633]|uniref:hypothetical protein n=1 Tax=Allomuricauda sp. CAU 1633 TaxID=2816036 RepID=UPI001A8D88A4|nr:hypothetical protein [Muricauda sp. CAU 1633]MBO0322889.1 hypothetical protein [Muricauda sp. CAU 1633]